MKYRYISLTLLAAFSATGGKADVPQAVQSAPKLVVNIAIDQLRTDYLEAFTPLYGTEGFRLLLTKGKVYENASKWKRSLCLMNSLVGSANIKEEFISLVSDYPEVIKCIPVLLACREVEMDFYSADNYFHYDFNLMNQSPAEYAVMMENTGLFGLLSHHIIKDLNDYIIGVEAGLDSNARKNRGGTSMENRIYNLLLDMGLEEGKDFDAQVKASMITHKTGIDLGLISHDGTTEKKFDFVIYREKRVYAIEVNYYGSGGSKLNETARSYKTIALEAKGIPDFAFVWITDGPGWKSAKPNLEETFDVLDTIFNINDLNNGSLEKLLR